MSAEGDFAGLPMQVPVLDDVSLDPGGLDPYPEAREFAVPYPKLSSGLYVQIFDQPFDDFCFHPSFSSRHASRGALGEQEGRKPNATECSERYRQSPEKSFKTSS
jgi:hypothetical protein